VTISALRAAVESVREAEGGPNGLNAFLALADPDADAGRGSEGGSAEAGDENGGGRILAGVTVALKDNLATLDLPTTCASRLLEGYRSPFEATVVRKVREAGALIVGKTNLDEFAMGSSTENSAYGPTLNPHDRTRVPGGSSGGSAAAVAAGYVRVALGSDTGGSVRQPAALCGVVGIKPTYGRVSRYGLVAFASSLDQVGTFGRTVQDAAMLLEVVAGHDPRDATSVVAPVPGLTAALRRDPEGVVIGIPDEFFPDTLDAAVRVATDRAVAVLRDAGCEVRSVSLPHSHLAIPCYYVLAPAEASSNLARYDGVRYGLRAPGRDIVEMYERTRHHFGAEVKRRIMIGTYALSAGYYDQYYGAAQKARALIAGDFRRVFAGGVDALFTPATPGPAFPIGERVDDPLSMYLSDVFTVTANLAGVPGMSVPIGKVRGLPVGGQILAPWWHEERMVALAAVLERGLVGVDT
jgi:aspartyl-tRNA(Asn)/glutamyl-tRNA(Gln) amidotransferase subunit A